MPIPHAPKPAVEVQKNALGFHELRDKPSQESLQKYYAEKYYQQQIRTHQTHYSDQELAFRHNKLDQKLRVLTSLRSTPLPKQPAFLDVGAGEGFGMAFFAGQGWQVQGLDYSAHGCETHHPALLNHLMTGDLQTLVGTLADQGQGFDAILLDNVLEHLLDPALLMRSLAPLMNDEAVLIIEVPNDFSAMQTHLLAQQKIDHPFWVQAPDHISYFNRHGLSALAQSCGFKEACVLADFPIDLFLFNEHTNYTRRLDVGKSCHQARVDVENLFHALSPEATIQMYKAMADLGVGRQIMGFYQRA